ncbi:MAG: transposase [Eubacteriales bacterium]
MARTPREISNLKYYHVMIQGNNKNKLFLDDEDKKRMLEIIRNIVRIHRTKVIAYCVMDNHAHFLIKEEHNISSIMKKINSSYAIYFNKKYNSSGHVFEDRFKSECIKSESQLLPVIRYIHNNPQRCGLSVKLEYKWSSYCEYIQHKEESIIDKKNILNQFDGNYEKALIKFIEYNNKENNDIFLDMTESVENKIVKMIESYLSQNDINFQELGYKKNIEHRIQLVLLLKIKGNLSIRKIAEILQLNRGVVYKIITDYLKE